MEFISSLVNEHLPAQRNISDLFEGSARAQEFSVKAAELFLDYSKQNITRYELSQLVNWAEDNDLSQQIKDMFSGKKINTTENRAVLHTVLRAPSAVKHKILANDAVDVEQTEQKMVKIVDDVSQGKLKSASGEQFTDVLAIGIGGSFYGIKLGLTALTPYHSTGLNVHVLSNVDGAAVSEKLGKLNVETTLVIVISKTFTTQETLLNAQAVKQWMLKKSSAKDVVKHQWFAVSTNIDAAVEFGLQKNHVLPMWDWVGGRFSLWSAVGLPLALAIGNVHFEKLKHGAYNMDRHFQNTEFSQNMPVLMALLGMWNRNGLGYQSLAVLPYDHALRAFPGYLQQIDMESNGKSVSVEGEKLTWSTAPIVFGQEGTNGQHAFMQLMHQSDDIIPADFIVALQGSSEFKQNHKVLVANCFAQSEALMQGKTLARAQTELTDDDEAALAVHKTMKGNTPSNTLLMKELTPESLGALLALYEHKIFVQGALWQVNSYDQWGVELGKQLGSEVLALMADDKADHHISASSINLIKTFTESNF